MTEILEFSANSMTFQHCESTLTEGHYGPEVAVQRWTEKDGVTKINVRCAAYDTWCHFDPPFSRCDDQIIAAWQAAHILIGLPLPSAKEVKRAKAFLEKTKGGGVLHAIPPGKPLFRKVA